MGRAHHRGSGLDTDSQHTSHSRHRTGGGNVKALTFEYQMTVSVIFCFICSHLL